MSLAAVGVGDGVSTVDDPSFSPLHLGIFYCSPLKIHCQVGQPVSGLSGDVWLWLVHSRTVPKTLVIKTILLSCFGSVFGVKVSCSWFEFCLTFLPNIRNLMRSANRMLEIKAREWRLLKCCSAKNDLLELSLPSANGIFLQIAQFEKSPKPLLCRNDETLSRKLLSSLSKTFACIQSCFWALEAVISFTFTWFTVPYTDRCQRFLYNTFATTLQSLFSLPIWHIKSRFIRAYMIYI